MKIAHLILVHQNPSQLQRLIQRLAHENAVFYIHVDSKTEISPFLFLASKSVIFILKRVNIKWGAYSMVQATVNCLTEVLMADNKYGYINLMSGQDYPLKSAKAIHDFLGQNPNKAFMHSLSVENEWQEAIPRLTKYHLTNYDFLGKYTLENILNKWLPSRKLPNNLIAIGRSQWFTITSQHAEYIITYLKKNKNVKRYFEFTWGSDEFVFQTILFNSIYQKDMVNDNLRYIDWSDGNSSPKTLTINDLDILVNSGKLFARKFNETYDSAILNELDRL